jgi:ribosome maturation factor RimP
MQGMLGGIEGDIVRLNVGSEELRVPLADITKANLVYRF